MTKNEFLKNAPRIAIGVINQFGGWESFKGVANDVASYGIDGGFSGFIYYVDTHKFTLKNRAAIIELLNDTAGSLGEDVVKMVGSFGVFGKTGMDEDDKKDLYKFLSGGKPSQGTVTNVLAWFAAEEVCRMYADN